MCFDYRQNARLLLQSPGKCSGPHPGKAGRVAVPRVPMLLWTRAGLAAREQEFGFGEAGSSK